MNDVPQGQPQPQAGLQPRLIKGNQADYEPASWPGHNDSGLIPFGDYVIVKMDQCSGKTKGGVSLPDELIERMNEAAESGCVYEAADGAFTRYDDGRPWTGAKPEPGDRVCIEKYAGIKQRGPDGAMYRIMGYRSIAAGQQPVKEHT